MGEGSQLNVILGSGPIGLAEQGRIHGSVLDVGCGNLPRSAHGTVVRAWNRARLSRCFSPRIQNSTGDVQ